ncbi:MAG: Na/Pi cotransporter family protein [Flavobacteriales bacterium]|nr:Na/Pi cotransporter family protein [Flavobacteriales bacterium]
MPKKILILLCLCFSQAITLAGQEEFVPELHGAYVDEERVNIGWKVDCSADKVPEQVVVRYNRSAVLANEGEIWLFTDTVSFLEGSIPLKELFSASSYIYQVGFIYQESDGSSATSWTNRERFGTKMEWGFTRFLLMIGSLCLFMFGMKTMSEGIQAGAGAKLRGILGLMTKNRFTGVLTGFSLTGLFQSSSATTVMTVSFVNAGLITLTESAGIMMGANIGTTITGWLVSIVGFRVDIINFALIIFALIIPLFLIKQPGVRNWVTALIGFALIFLGLGFLIDTVPTFTENSALVQFFVEYSNQPFLGTLMFIALGTILTVVVQSSSSTLTLTMALCASGVIPFNAAAAMVLGENIGTTATAEISALVGNVYAKRSARIHTFFNVIGVVWMALAMPFILELIGDYMVTDPYEESEAGRQSATIALAAFHSVFNLVNLLVLIWFIPQLVNLATRTVRSKGAEDEEFRLEYIDSSIQLSEISMLEAKRQVVKFGEVVSRMSNFVKNLLTETDFGNQKKIVDRIKKYEDITDRMEIEISQYCGRLSAKELSPISSDQVRAYLSIGNDLERIGDIFYQMARTLERKSSSKIWFAPDQREKLLRMFGLIDMALDQMLENLKKESIKDVSLEKAKSIEAEINSLRNKLRREYISRIESGNYNLRSGTIYSDLFSSLEKVGDHVESVSEALIGEI